MFQRRTVLLAACMLAMAFGPARAQEDDGDDDAAAPIVVDIDGPCQLTVKGQDVPCRGVAYMLFPRNHRIDFTAIADTAGWAFSGEQDDNQAGRYTLEIDSVLNPGSGRFEAEGRCEMQVAEDRRSVKSLDCRAGADDGEFALKASGTVTVEDEDDEEDDGPEGN